MLCCSVASRQLNFYSIINSNKRQCTYFVTLWGILNICTSTAENISLRVILARFNIVSEGTRWRSWLRHCATRRKVAVSIPDVVIGFFH
jgi:hypothetical protein